MDRLLRRYARRNAETLPTAGDGRNESAEDQTSGAHMDADELNAYAEDALPMAARARYFAHLADCDSCRKLVTELTLASGALVEEKHVAVAETPRSNSWREWLAAIFSPPVLRYAVPALALFGVIIVAVVMMRARREETSVAQNNEGTSNSALRTPANENSSGEDSSANTSVAATSHANANIANGNIASPLAQASPTPMGVVSAPEQEKPATTTQTENGPPLNDSPNAKPAVAQTGLDEKRPGTFGEGDKRGEVAGGAPAPQPAPAPVLAAPPPAKTADSTMREEQAKTKNPPKDDDAVVAIDRAGAASTTNKVASNEARRDRARKATESLASSASGRAAASPKKEAGDVTVESERPAETRSVGGRQFRKQGNAWVDAAYNSARTTINVARGSEQYRALLADEPGLRSITQQLGGEVIVVWKGRAYRFY